MMMLNEKIRGSLGRNLSCTSRWLRLVFDHKLKEVCAFSADQAILLMILSCDERGERDALIQSAGIVSPEVDQLFNPLIKEGYLQSEDDNWVGITEKGKELIGKIWNIHEFTENLALNGFTEEEKKLLSKFMHKIQDNLSQVMPFE